MRKCEELDQPRIRRLASYVRFATVGVLLAMFIGTHIPGGMEPQVAYNDKLVHFTAYMTLTIFVLASWELSTGPLRAKHYVVVAILGAIYGAFDELTQIPVGRSCDFMDWVADVVGVIAGMAVYRLLSPVVYRLLLIRPRLAKSSQQ